MKQIEWSEVDTLPHQTSQSISQQVELDRIQGTYLHEAAALAQEAQGLGDVVIMAQTVQDHLSERVRMARKK